MYFQLFSRFLSEPKFAKELFEERAEIKQDIDHRNHKYDYNFDSVFGKDNFIPCGCK